MKYEEIDGQRKVERAMELLILSVYEAQSENGPAVDRLVQTNPKAYLNEYCTVRVAAPRRAGHTQAIVNLGESFYREGVVSYAVTPSSDLVKEWAARTNPKVEIFSIGSLEWLSPVTILFVDNATFLTKGQIEKIEKFALRCIEFRGPQFILVYVQ